MCLKLQWCDPATHVIRTPIWLGVNNAFISREIVEHITDYHFPAPRRFIKLVVAFYFRLSILSQWQTYFDIVVCVIGSKLIYILKNTETAAEHCLKFRHCCLYCLGSYLPDLRHHAYWVYWLVVCISWQPLYVVSVPCRIRIHQSSLMYNFVWKRAGIFIFICHVYIFSK